MATSERAPEIPLRRPIGRNRPTWSALAWPIIVAIAIFGLAVALNWQFAVGVSAVRWVPSEFVARASVALSTLVLLTWLLALIRKTKPSQSGAASAQRPGDGGV